MTWESTFQGEAVFQIKYAIYRKHAVLVLLVEDGLIITITFLQKGPILGITLYSPVSRSNVKTFHRGVRADFKMNSPVNSHSMLKT